MRYSTGTGSRLDEPGPTPDRRDAMELRLINRFWTWWLSELSGMVPEQVKAAVARRQRYPEVFLKRSQILVYGRHATGDMDANLLLATTSLDEAVAAIKGALGRALIGRKARVVLDADDCLVRTVRLNSAASAKIDQILRLQIAQIVPLPAADILHDWYPIEPNGRDGTVAVKHVIAKRTLVQPLLERLAREGLAATSVGVRTAEHGALPVDLMRHDRSPAIDAPAWPTGLMRASISALAVMAVLTLYVAFDRQDQALSELLARLDRARAEAMAIQRQVKEQDEARRAALSVFDRKNARYSVVEVWEEVTRILPDGAWLTHLAADDQALVLTGFAQAASELILILDGSPTFEAAAFTAPVIRDAGAKAERFSIRLNLAGRKPTSPVIKQALSR